MTNLIFAFFLATAMALPVGMEATKVATQRHFVEDWAGAAGIPLSIETMNPEGRRAGHKPGDHLYKVKVQLRNTDNSFHTIETYIWFYFPIDGDPIVEKEVDYDHSII